MQADLDQSFFAFRISTATPTEVEYMAAMAALGDGPQPVSECGATTRSSNSSSSAGHGAFAAPLGAVERVVGGDAQPFDVGLARAYLITEAEGGSPLPALAPRE